MNKKRYIGFWLMAFLVAVMVLPQITIAQEQPPTDDNTCVNVDFGDLDAGTIVSNQIPGMTITTDDPVNHPAMIFDSSNPTGGDLDLGTPNVDFGGPGRGAGGRTGASGENSVALGNLLIISEDGDSSDPDDNAGGGQVIFTFDNPVTVESIILLDLDESESATVALFSETDAELLSVAVGPADGSGNNGVYPAALNTARVVRMVVTFPGSGAIASVVVCRDTVVTPTPDPTDPPVCEIDLVLVFDESSGVSPFEFEAQRTFLLGLVNSLPVAPDSANIGIGSISTFSDIHLPITGDKTTIVDTLTNHIKGNGFSNIITAIFNANSELNNNGRPGVPNVMVLISDGDHFLGGGMSPTTPEAMADNARADGTIIYAIGVPDDSTGVPNIAVLQGVANDPDSEFYFQTDFNNIDDANFISAISTSLCPDVGNLPPVANNDSYVTDMDVPLNVPAPGILLNDSDPNGDSITVSSFEPVSVEGGTVVVNPDGSFSYTPPAGFTGSDSFQYTNTDGEFDSNVATVTIRILGDNETPPPNETPEATPPVDQTPEVTPPPSCSITHLELWNADTDSVIMTPLSNGNVIDVAAFGNARVTIVAVTDPSSVGSVEFTLFGPETRLDVENATPYSLFGDNEAGDYYGEHLNTGDYTVTVRAFTEAYLNGQLCSEVSVNFSVVDTSQPEEPKPVVTEEPGPVVTEEPGPVVTEEPGPVQTEEPAPTCEITAFEIWNAENGAFITQISNNAIIELSSLGGAKITIVALTNPAPVGSVMMVGMGQNRVENEVPYTLFGNTIPNFQGTHPAVGDYSVTATAYTEAYADGVVCDQETINFSIVDTPDDGPPPDGDGPPPDGDNPPPDNPPDNPEPPPGS